MVDVEHVFCYNEYKHKKKEEEEEHMLT